jgi:hypothetical protein
MYKPTTSGKYLNGILRKALEEISMGKTDLFHLVLAEVLEEVAVLGMREGENSEKTGTKRLSLTSVRNDD